MQDCLSFLLRQYDIGVSIDKICDLNAEFRLAHPASRAGKLYWHFVVQGQAELHIALHQPLILTAPSIVFLPYSSSHTLQNCSLDSSLNNIICGSLNMSGDAAVFFGSLPSVLYLQGDANSESAYCLLLAACAKVILQEREFDGKGARLGCKGVVEQLIKTLFMLSLRQHLEQHEQHSGALLALLTPRLDKAMQAMFASPSTHFSVEALAKIANMSRASFARNFKQTTGVAPLNMLLHVRMNLAASALAQPKCHIGSLCFDLGYASQSSFHKAFSRYFGQTPGQYRQQALQLGEQI